MLEKTLSPLDCKESNQSVLNKINPEVFIERDYVEASILTADMKSTCIEQDLDAVKPKAKEEEGRE